MQLLESGEMYLETILVLSQKGSVRAIDISNEMNYSKPSVSRAMSILKNEGYIFIDENNLITLTEKGTAVAEKIYERHTILSTVLMQLGVSQKTATEDACKIEHCISDETMEAIKAHIKKYQ